MSRIVRQIPAERIKQWNEMLASRAPIEGTKRGEVIEKFDIHLFDGETYDVEFKLVNGDDSGPYLDVILWDDGSEVFVHDAGSERLDRDWFLRDSYMNKEYTLVIEAQ